MRRSLLLSVSVLGLLICVIGGTGLFAALSDTAHTGTNTAESKALASSSDLQLATATIDPINGILCGPFTDHLATPLITLQNIEAGFGYGGSFWCVKNAGSQSNSLSITVDQLTDVDFGCTGDEADYADTTCGGDQLGELSSVVTFEVVEYDCLAGFATSTYGSDILGNLSQYQKPLGVVGAGQYRCFGPDFQYPSTTSAADRQKAQSDRTTWRFVFTGQAS